MVERVMEDPFIPEHFGINQKGMQAFKELQGGDRDRAIQIWLDARNESVRHARNLALGLNVHKQIANRLLEPWMWITVCVTGDAGAWSNYFSLRCHPDAEPHIQKQAYMAQKAYFTSKPVEKAFGEWHTPYILPTEYGELAGYITRFLDFPAVVHVSVGRCARTSYLTQEGTRDYAEDIKLHDRLTTHTPLHASPLEHVCQAQGDDERYGKYIGWKAYRHMLPREYVTDFKPNHPELEDWINAV